MIDQLNIENEQLMGRRGSHSNRSVSPLGLSTKSKKSQFHPFTKSLLNNNNNYMPLVPQDLSNKSEAKFKLKEDEDKEEEDEVDLESVTLSSEEDEICMMETHEDIKELNNNMQMLCLKRNFASFVMMNF